MTLSETAPRRLAVSILDDYQGVASSFGPWQTLSEAVELVTFRDHVASEDELVARLAAMPIVVLMRERTPFRRSLISRLPDLRLLITTGMSNSSIDLEAATDHGVTVCGTRGYEPPTAELTWGLILAVARNICREDRAVRAGAWQRHVGLDLAGRTLGVVGLGSLGKRVAAIGGAFGMDVVAWSQNLDEEAALKAGARATDKAGLFSQADVVTIHLRLGQRTRGLVGPRELAWMQPHACLINTSRGPIVDEGALVDALRAGGIAGAGLDVFHDEPLPTDHPFMTLDNVVLTPHIGYVTQGSYSRYYHDVVEDIAAWLRGSPVRVL